jgi:hypothetical protein
MAAGHTVISAENVVQTSVALNLPQVLEADDASSSVTYRFNSSGVGSHEQYVNGVLNRTNWATNASGETEDSYTLIPGTGGVATLSVDDILNFKNGDSSILAHWTTGPTGGTHGVSYKQVGITGASGSKVSGGVWLYTYAARTFKLALNLFNGATPAGSGLSGTYSLAARTWTFIKFENLAATSAYNTVEVYVQPQANMPNGGMIALDGVLIEKTASLGPYFDRYTIDPQVNIIASARESISVFDSSAIADDVFELDTSDVVNEIKVEMYRFIGTAGEPGWEYGDQANVHFDQIFTDEASSRKTTPQTRSIATDWAIRDAYLDDELPTSVMVTKGMLLLSGQSKAQWRLSNALTLVLDEVPAQENINQLISEYDRFGALIRIDNGPSFIPTYMRVRGGRYVFGESPSIELDLEPVEYSAPIPLTGSTLKAENLASYFKIQNFKTLTSNDLRTIGAR